MGKTVVIVGALDTKGAEFALVKSLIERAGAQTLVVDFGVLGEPAFTPQVSRAQVCAAAGGELSRFSDGARKDEAMATMAGGLAAVVKRLHAEGRLDAILGMGGSGGTSLATTAMRELPVGVPKLMVSTVAGGDVRAYVGTRDITFMPSIVDVAGINRISRKIYANAAAAIAGMVLGTPAPDETNVVGDSVPSDKPLVAASMFGNTTLAVDHARRLVEDAGYEVLVFHATGSGGRTMESLIADGYFAASLDITTTELADTVCGGVFDAGEQRCIAAGRAGIPAVVVPGCVDMANFGAIQTVPERYRERQLYQWNPDVTLLRTNIEENRRIGEMLAAAVNSSGAPAAVLVPLGGVSMLDSDGQRFWDPVADQACFEAIRSNLKPGIAYVEDAHNINDPAFSGLAARTLLEMLR